MKSYNLTTAEVAELLNYNVQHVRRLASEGVIPGVRRRRQWFFNQLEVLSIYDPNTNSPATLKDGRDTLLASVIQRLKADPDNEEVDDDVDNHSE